MKMKTKPIWNRLVSVKTKCPARRPVTTRDGRSVLFRLKENRFWNCCVSVSFRCANSFTTKQCRLLTKTVQLSVMTSVEWRKISIMYHSASWQLYKDLILWQTVNANIQQPADFLKLIDRLWNFTTQQIPFPLCKHLFALFGIKRSTPGKQNQNNQHIIACAKKVYQQKYHIFHR